MKTYRFFEELFKKRSIDAVKKFHPDLTEEKIAKFFNEVIEKLKKDNDSATEVYVDGASSSNPGNAGIGVVVKQDGKIVKELSEYIGIATNNVAEYLALIRGLKTLSELGIKSAIVYSDSELVVKQINGEYTVRSQDLLKLYKEVKKLAERFEKLEIYHIERDKNKHADMLAKRASLK